MKQLTIVSMITLFIFGATAQAVELWGGDDIYLTVDGNNARAVFGPSGCGFAVTEQWNISNPAVLAEGIYSFRTSNGGSPGMPVVLAAAIQGDHMKLNFKFVGGSSTTYELVKNAPNLVPACRP